MKQKKDIGLGWLVKDLISAAIYSIITFVAFNYILPTLPADEVFNNAIVLFIILGSIGLTLLIRKTPSLILSVSEKFMKDNTGIIKTYSSLDDAVEDLKNDFKNSSKISLFLQIGRKELGDGESSIFGELIKGKVADGDCIRVLHASKGSPFLSDSRARARSNRYVNWMNSIERLEGIISIHKQNYVKIESREHKQPYLWRIFIFDEIAYVSGYLFDRNNDKKARVYKLCDGRNSLYIIFKKYFEYLWASNCPENSENEVLDWSLRN